MFNVQNKETGAIKTVFAVHGTMFVMWDEDGDCWLYADSNKFRPVAEVSPSVYVDTKKLIYNFGGLKHENT